jgi:hypothetical protein
MKNLKMSSIKAILFFVLAFIGNSSFAGTTIRVNLNSGADGLRPGNTGFLTVNYTDGTTSQEYVVTTGLGSNTGMVFTKELVRTITSVSEVKNIVFRHDGAPRAGMPFDTYGNWDVAYIRAAFTINGAQQTFSAVLGNPLVVRFTGKLRIYTLNPPPPPPTTSLLKVFLTTGTGELRGGNTAFMTITYADGSISQEYVLGGGFGQNSVIVKEIRLNRALSANTEITSIMIRHDGNPRAGQPFDTYGNWTLQAIRVALVMPNGAEINVVNSTGNPLKQFNGNERKLPLNRISQ